MKWNTERIAQIQLPDPPDEDPHPRLLLGGYGIQTGSCYTALFPAGWHDITLEMRWGIPDRRVGTYQRQVSLGYVLLDCL